MITVKVTGLDSVRAELAGLGKQVRFATAKALTQTAHQVREDIKAEMKAGIQGGATAYALRGFNVDMATRDNLTARTYLREDGPAGGTPYTQALGHLFTGGRRRWKRLEGWLRGKGMIPSGYMIAPGPSAPIDSRGNFRAGALKEMLTILSSNTRNLEATRGGGKSIGFFIARPGDKSGLPPGIWRRITTQHKGNSARRQATKARSGTVQAWIMFIKPTGYRQQFDLEKTAKRTVDRIFTARFDKALADALRTAR